VVPNVLFSGSRNWAICRITSFWSNRYNILLGSGFNRP